MKNDIIVYNYSWEHIEKMCKEFANTLYNNVVLSECELPEYIFAIGTGGLIPATIIAKQFELKVINIGVVSRIDSDTNIESVNDLITYQPAPLSFTDEKHHRILIVDDIWDSGRTATKVHSSFASDDVIVYTMLLREDSKVPDNINHQYSEIIPENVWARFAWEQEIDNGNKQLQFEFDHS